MLMFTVLIAIILFGSFNNIKMIDKNYDISNNNLYKCLSEELEPDDVIVSAHINALSLASLYCPDYKYYLYYTNGFTKPEAFEAFSPELKVVYDYQFLDSCNGRVWILSPTPIEDADISAYERYSGNRYNLKLFNFENERNSEDFE